MRKHREQARGEKAAASVPHSKAVGGLAPFVEMLPSARKAGSKVAILGNNLTGTTSVTFNGIPSRFTVVSSTEVAATVPSNATTGTVQVVTPGGTLSSNVPFRVIP
ncbi:MAG TPA: IPT/TIG domain-containing protein [Terriglobia bacterium]|nr:IPT/TIG domain-containing protein [Terriglobia bacterium]